MIPTLQLGGLGRARAQSQASIPTWEEVITDLAPVIWLTMDQASPSDIETAGNAGSWGGTVSMRIPPDTLTCGNASIMPSEPSRDCVNVGAGLDAASIVVASTVTNNATMYFIYSGTTGNPEAVAWRARNWFLRFDGTFIRFRIRNANGTTTVAASSVLDGNPHLIGFDVTSSAAELWVDGLMLWSGSVAGSEASGTTWSYMANASSGSVARQKLYGYFGDFVVFDKSLSDTEHGEIYAAYMGVAP